MPAEEVYDWVVMSLCYGMRTLFCYRETHNGQEVKKVAREKKVLIVDEIEEQITSCSVGILTDYRGLSTSEITLLRKQLRGAGIRYRVVKNTLARLALQKAGKDEIASLFEGPRAIAFGYGDAVEPARILTDYIRGSKTVLSIKGGFLGDRVLSAEDVTVLARLPSREVLVSRVLGGMQSPIFNLVNCLASPMRGLAGVLQARIQQLEAK